MSFILALMDYGHYDVQRIISTKELTVCQPDSMSSKLGDMVKFPNKL